MPKENGQIKPQKHSPKGQRPVGEGKDKKNTEFQWKRAGKTSFIWVFILITAIFLSGLFTSGNQKAIEIQYYQYREFLEQKLIEKATIVEDVFTGRIGPTPNIFPRASVQVFCPAIIGS